MLLTYNEAFYDLKNALQPLYDEREAVAIAHEILYYVTDLDKIQRLLTKEKTFTTEQQNKFAAAAAMLLRGTPLQYVTGAAWFMGRAFYVNENVLIPRPETEELVDWIIRNNVTPDDRLNILDVGTGSGCIPVSLKLMLQNANITSCDISNNALQVAQKNAEIYNVVINFLQLDFLNNADHTRLGKYDIIVSNPPYIPLSEKERIHTNVKDHEPNIALFVPDDDALVFYKAIAAFGKEHLNVNGYIYCELDSAHATECRDLFEMEGYKDVEIRKDLHGNWRMLKARNNKV